MSATDWRIPSSVRRWLAEAPDHASLVVLLRHSVRDPLPPDEVGYTLPLTRDGVRIASELGALVGVRLRSLRTSPLTRCVQTAEALRAGAGVDVDIHPDRLLGDPGIYVIDDQRAWANWLAIGHAGVMDHAVSQDTPLPGMADTDAAARFLVQHMLACAADRPGVHVFVTHDALVLATAARLLREPLGREAWPRFLEGAFFWKEGEYVSVAYRDRQRRYGPGGLCGLVERDVVEFARREVARALGPDCPARFFLAGGAFKTLLSGRPPRDLDVWAPSERDRELLREVLRGRGAVRLDERPFADAFEVGDRVVELPHRCSPSTLEDRLARFDIALSAVGVEHRPGEHWKALIDPLARESVRRRQVLLLKPLVNWKYALTTLERMRRYALELGYAVPPSEEAEVWRVFDAQSSEMRQGMVARFERTAQGGFGVRRELACRLR